MASLSSGWQLLAEVAQQAVEGTPWWESLATILAIPAVLLGLVFTWFQIRKIRLDTKKVEQDLRSSEPSLRFRYLICKDPDIVREIARGDFHQLPMEGSLLRQTASGRFLENLVQEPPKTQFGEGSQVGQFASLDDYVSAHPDGLLRGERNPDPFPYFEAVRVPSRAELEGRISRNHPVVEAMLAAGAPSEEIAYVLLARGCGSQGFLQEIVQPRSLWAVYLEATNISSRPFVLESLEYANDQPEGIAYRPLAVGVGRADSLSFSKASLDPGGSVVIPVMAILPPLEPIEFEESHRQITDLADGRWQTLALSDMKPAEAGASVLGPAMWPKSMRVVDQEGSATFAVHELDLANVFVLNRGWRIGSCPHVFFRMTRTGILRYHGELFDRSPGMSQEHHLIIPAGVQTLIVAELEDETTTLQALNVDGRRVHADVRLDKGQELRIDVNAGNDIWLKGYYEYRGAVRTQPWRRNEIIAAYTSAKPRPERSVHQGSNLAP